jgi:hypothetical protein
MGTLYRVERDGRSFYVPEELVETYANMGYAVYRTVEERVEFGKGDKDEG